MNREPRDRTQRILDALGVGAAVAAIALALWLFQVWLGGTSIDPAFLIAGAVVFFVVSFVLAFRRRGGR